MMTAKEILENPKYQAISYGGYREKTREIQPTLEQLKEDMRILYAMGIRIIRTYNVKLPHASNILKAIKELKAEDARFEMYVMLGAWIDCENAWKQLPPNHYVESSENEHEVKRAVQLAKKYPEIVKVIAVGNEAMVRWATAYYVQPKVILNWVNYLQNLKKEGELSNDLWITSSDDFSSWGGGDSSYRTKDLELLIEAVDYLSIHTYPMHNTHYNPEFWGTFGEEVTLSNMEKIEKAMKRALSYAQSQYKKVKGYVDYLGMDKPIHIGETGWASVSNGFYGEKGSRAADEFKEALYYSLMREWTDKEGISCFYFEAFDEPWKDAKNPSGSENHFGLFTVDGKAKYALWDLVDQGVFEGLTRGKHPIRKSYKGEVKSLFVDVKKPPIKDQIRY
jgi:exo-beta-1,3-glucanase (GH17 family)